MATKLYGLDIGPDAVRAVVLKPTSDGLYQLVHAAEAHYPDGAIYPTQSILQTSPGIVTDAIKTVVKQRGFSRSGMTVATVGTLEFAHVMLPPAVASQRNLLPVLLSQELDIWSRDDPANLVLAWRPTGVTADTDPDSDVEIEVAAAARADILSLEDVLNRARIRPAHIDALAAAHIRAGLGKAPSDADRALVVLSIDDAAVYAHVLEQPGPHSRLLLSLETPLPQAAGEDTEDLSTLSKVLSLTAAFIGNSTDRRIGVVAMLGARSRNPDVQSLVAAALGAPAMMAQPPVSHVMSPAAAAQLGVSPSDEPPFIYDRLSKFDAAIGCALYSAVGGHNV